MLSVLGEDEVKKVWRWVNPSVLHSIHSSFIALYPFQKVIARKANGSSPIRKHFDNYNKYADYYFV